MKYADILYFFLIVAFAIVCCLYSWVRSFMLGEGLWVASSLCWLVACVCVASVGCQVCRSPNGLWFLFSRFLEKIVWKLCLTEQKMESLKVYLPWKKKFGFFLVVFFFFLILSSSLKALIGVKFYPGTGLGVPA